MGQDYVITILNASKVSYPQGWGAHEATFKTSASYDGTNWFYVPTTYDKTQGQLTMNIHLDQEEVQLAYFPPYTEQQHLNLMATVQAETTWTVTALGKTNGAEGRDITLITVGEPSLEKKKIWFMAGQHPGEHQGSHYMDGLIRHLMASFADHADIFEKAVFYLVPNMNPDGKAHGNLRTNLEGKDLNRMWQTASIKDSPEVYYVLEAMKRIGVDLFVDVHSDEVIPRGAFLNLGHTNSVTIDDRMMSLEQQFLALYIQATPLMQNDLKYAPKVRMPSNLDIASAYVAEHFKCPSVTLEMPTNQWTVAQCHQLGIAALTVMKQMLPLL